MENQISIIVSAQHHVEGVKEILKKNGLTYPVYNPPTLDHYQDVLPLTERLRAQGTKAIVLGQRVADAMKDADIPLIPIRRHHVSFVRPIRLAQQQSAQYAIIARKGLFSEAAQRSREYFDTNEYLIYTYDSESEFPALIQLCYQKGIRTVIGSSNRLHSQVLSMGMQYIGVPYEEDDVLLAIREAEALVRSIEERIESNEMLHIIQNVVDMGIVVVSSDQKIVSANTSAQKILGLSSSQLVGTDLEASPFSVLSQLRNIQQAENQSEIVVSVSRKMINLSINIIRINGQVKSVVLTFSSVEEIQKKEQNIRLKLYQKGHTAKYSFDRIIGSSGVYQSLISRAKRYANADSTIFIYGPSGCGKEVFAQSIHNSSSRRDDPFVVINCAALPESLLESTLFGYEGGAFTGSRKEGLKGLFEIAHKGTVFIDEISEMPLSLQARFLRVIQEREISRIGSDHVIPIDVRIICATNRNLLEMVRQQTFREDLYYRISVLMLTLPPLSAHQEDVSALAQSFLSEISRGTQMFAEDGLSYLSQLRYQGNIRQLRNIVERISILADTKEICVLDIQNILAEDYSFINTTIHTNLPSAPGDVGAPRITLSRKECLEKEQLVRAIQASQGDRDAVLTALGMSKSTLWRKIKKYNLQLEDLHSYGKL